MSLSAVPGSALPGQSIPGEVSGILSTLSIIMADGAAAVETSAVTLLTSFLQASGTDVGVVKENVVGVLTPSFLLLVSTSELAQTSEFSQAPFPSPVTSSESVVTGELAKAPFPGPLVAQDLAGALDGMVPLLLGPGAVLGPNTFLGSYVTPLVQDPSPIALGDACGVQEFARVSFPGPVVVGESVGATEPGVQLTCPGPATISESAGTLDAPLVAPLVLPCRAAETVRVLDASTIEGPDVQAADSTGTAELVTVGCVGPIPKAEGLGVSESSAVSLQITHAVVEAVVARESSKDLVPLLLIVAADTASVVDAGSASDDLVVQAGDSASYVEAVLAPFPAPVQIVDAVVGVETAFAVAGDLVLVTLDVAFTSDAGFAVCPGPLVATDFSVAAESAVLVSPQQATPRSLSSVESVSPNETLAVAVTASAAASDAIRTTETVVVDPPFTGTLEAFLVEGVQTVENDVGKTVLSVVAREQVPTFDVAGATTTSVLDFERVLVTERVRVKKPHRFRSVRAGTVHPNQETLSARPLAGTGKR